MSAKALQAAAAKEALDNAYSYGGVKKKQHTEPIAKADDNA